MSDNAPIRILVIEDDEALYGVISSLIESLGMIPLHAADGQEGLRMYTEHSPHMCLVDVLLPRHNGFKVCRDIKTRLGGENIPVVMMSSVYRNAHEFKADLAECGAEDFIVKPFSMVDLRDLLLHYTQHEPEHLEIPEERSTPVGLGEQRSLGALVLVADPDVSVNGIIVQLLQTLGYTPIQAFSGQEAMDAVLANTPALCLVDMLLPELSGRELTRQIKQELGKNIPVLLMGSLESNDAELGLGRPEFQADGYIAKPFAATRLAKMVEMHLTTVYPRVLRTIQASEERLEPRGVLRPSSYARLLHTLFMLKLSGVLKLTGERTEREIYFLEGYPVYARSEVISESLIALAVEMGLLELHKVDHAIASKGTPLGQELVRAGLMTPKQLLAVQCEQARIRTLAGFALRGGQYDFQAGDDFRDRIPIFELNPIALIREGSARYHNMNTLTDQLQRKVGLYLVPSHRFDSLSQHFPVDDRELRLLSLITGARTLGDLLRYRILDVTPTLRLVWDLRQAGMIAFESQRAKDPREIEVKAMALLEHGPESDPHHPAWEYSNDEVHRLCQDILDTYIMLGQSTIYEILDISPDANSELFLEHCTHVMSRFEPSCVLGLAEHYRNKANAIHNSIRSWQRKYATVESRRQYNLSLETDPGPEDFDMTEGAVAYGHARRAMARGDWSEAVARLEAASTLSPENTDIISDLAWSIYQLPNRKPFQLSQSEALLRQVLVQDGHHILGLVRLAHIEAERGDTLDATERVNLVLDLDPGHEQALALKERLEPGSSKQSQDDQRSLWNRLFGDS